MAKTQIIGLDKFRTGLAVALAASRKDLTDGLRQMAAELVEAIKADCPTKTGALKASIKYVEHSRTSGPGVEIWIGDSKVFYAAHVEYGTSRAPAHPFVRPVVERFRKKYPGQIEQMIAQTWSSLG